MPSVTVQTHLGTWLRLIPRSRTIASTFNGEAEAWPFNQFSLRLRINVNPQFSREHLWLTIRDPWGCYVELRQGWWNRDANGDIIGNGWAKIEQKHGRYGIDDHKMQQRWIRRCIHTPDRVLALYDNPSRRILECALTTADERYASSCGIDRRDKRVSVRVIVDYCSWRGRPPRGTVVSAYVQDDRTLLTLEIQIFPRLSGR